jgi:hypothetical protein
MLTIENIKAVDGINDEQAAKIAELSKADEDKVIGDKFGEVYRNLDSIIEKSTGVKRNGDEKHISIWREPPTRYALRQRQRQNKLRN